MCHLLCNVRWRIAFPCGSEHCLFHHTGGFFFCFVLSILIQTWFYTIMHAEWHKLYVCIMNFCEDCFLLPLVKALLWNHLMYIPMGWSSVRIKAKTNLLLLLPSSFKLKEDLLQYKMIIQKWRRRIDPLTWFFGDSDECSGKIAPWITWRNKKPCCVSLIIFYQLIFFGL